MNSNKAVSAQLIKLLANNVAAKEGQLLQLAYDSIRKRIADALIDISRQEKSNLPFSSLSENLFLEMTL